MKNKLLLFSVLIFLPIVTPQSVEDVVKSIEELNQKVEKFIQPENYSEFYHSNFQHAGEFGSYDFIIIGAGSAGTLLANRLSEIENWNILLLEAGQDETLYSDIPGLAGNLQFTNFNWAYKTVPQKTCCLGMKNNQCKVPRGKVMGGSSTINYMIYTRGNKEDYDKWAQDGNPGWSYDEVLPYFLKSENSSLNAELIDEDYHNKNGTLHLEHVRNFGPLTQAFLDGNEELGRKTLDFNGKDEMGFSRTQSNTINGRRCSGNKAFIESVLSRKNLTIKKGAFVTKLYINKSSEINVWGVEFLVGDKKYYANATKEVIVSAGAIASPQILMHSGIGPKDHLESLGIDVVTDLPVGQNFHDHPVLLYPMSSNFTDPGLNTMDKMVEDYVDGFGYLTAAVNVQSIGYINTRNKSSSYPDIEQMISVSLDVANKFFENAFNYKTETVQAYVKPFTSASILAVSLLLHPKTRGTITLKSKSVFEHPLIDFNFFSDPDDLEVLVNGLKDFFALIDTEAMKKFNVTVENNRIPECPQEDYRSDDYLRCMVRHMASSSFHPAGTCKMGPDSDPQAVVDAKLRVKGVKNLRVIDASVIPFPLSAHNNAPTYMIAEKGSSLVKSAWQNV